MSAQKNAQECAQKSTHTFSDTQGGFTLIEIIVSLAIFAVVAVVAVGAFLKIIDANKKSQTLKTAINNVNFALESMTREMRVGSNYTLINGNGVPSTLPAYGFSYSGDASGKTIAFVSSKTDASGCGLIHAYYFDNSTGKLIISKASQTACGSAAGLGSSEFIPLISADVTIDNAYVKIVTANSSAGPQPRMSLRLRGHSGTSEKTKTLFDVQTTVSQRNAF
ncbi:MAG: hypothetical protein RIT04_670 [Candidatus Parcubacteria bacterium]